MRGSLHDMACSREVCVCTPVRGWVRETPSQIERMSDNVGNAERAGDSSAADNRIDFAVTPSGQLSPGSGGVLRSIEGIVR